MLPTIATGNVSSALAGEYEVANSCRFDSASTDRLTRTITGTNTTKFTASMWVKLADDGPSIFYANEANSSDYIFIQHNSQFISG